MAATASALCLASDGISQCSCAIHGSSKATTCTMELCAGRPSSCVQRPHCATVTAPSWLPCARLIDHLPCSSEPGAAR
jgi:hypothetical protein